MENLNNYYNFYMVAKEGNVSKAADKLYISQPAVSKSISKLEETMGVALFSRSSRGVNLTEEGQLLYSYVEKAFENLLKGEDNVKKFNDLGMGHIRIGVSTSLCKYILLDYLKDFIRQNPHIKVSIDCHSTLNTIELLKKNEIDVGLICNTPLPKEMVYHPLREIHDIFVANYDYIDNFQLRETEETFSLPDATESNPSDLSHMLFGNLGSVFMNKDSKHTLTSEKTLELLEKSNLMLLEEANVTRTHIDQYLSSNNIKCRQILEINNMDLLIDFAAIGMGVSSVVREFALEYLKSGQVVELPLKNPIPKRTVGLVYPGNQRTSNALKKFLQQCNII